MTNWPTKKRPNANAKIPFGYKPSEEDPLILLPFVEEIEWLEKAMDFLDEGHSFRKTAEWLSEKIGKSISHQGIALLWKRHRGTQSKRIKELKKQARQKRPATWKEKEELRVKRKAAGAKRSLTAQQKKLAEMQASKQVPTETSDSLDFSYVSQQQEQQQEVIFSPNPGPQTEFLAADEREVLYGGSAGGGKMVKYQSLILTPFGWRKLEDLSVGSTICSVDGSVTKIIGYHPQPVKPFYRITFADGAQVECCEDHLWLLHTAGKGRKIKGSKVFGSGSAKIWVTSDIFSHYQKDNVRFLGTPIPQPVCFTVSGQKKGPNRFIKRDLDPYILGVLLGDGSITAKHNISVTSADPEIAEYLETVFGESLTYYQKNNNRAKNYRIPGRFVWNHLEDIGLAGTKSLTKFIPRIYKMGTEDQRWSLLQGLMDTDGCAEADGDATFCSISEKLADDVRELARSLGCWVSKRSKDASYLNEDGDRIYCNTAYELRIKCKTPEKLFRLERKKEKVRGKVYQSMANWIVDIEAIEPSDGACITVDHPSRLFIMEDYVVTHNSYALLADPLRYFGNQNFNGIMLRHTNDELRELIWKSQEMYPKAYPGAKWQEKKSQWIFPSGARLWMTYLERDEDVLRYTGQAFCYIAFDELTHHATPFAWNYMRSRLRTTDSTLPLHMRATTNPGGPGHGWVKAMFIDPAPAGNRFPATNIETGEVLKYPKGHEKEGLPLFYRRFIPARLKDNPYLMKDGQYEANLLALPEMQRRQLLEGDWTIADGAAFSEFREHIHVCEPFDIPRDWRRFRSCDYGYSSFSAIHWYAIDPSYETLYVYRELYLSKHTGKDLARAVLDAEKGESIAYGVLDSSAWHNRGQIGPSIAEEMIAMGCRWRPSDRSAGARVAGKNILHQRLKVDEATGLPGIVFFNTCRQIIADLPVIPSDPKGGDDIDPRFRSDHAYDSVRYGVMSRPRAVSPFDFGQGVPEQHWRPADPVLGY